MDPSEAVSQMSETWHLNPSQPCFPYSVCFLRSAQENDFSARALRLSYVAVIRMRYSVLLVGEKCLWID